MNYSINKSHVFSISSFLLGVASATFYIKYTDYKNCKKKEEDKLLNDGYGSELCDQSVFDGSQRTTINKCEKNKEVVKDDNEEMKTSEEWNNEDTNIKILDYDGWNDCENFNNFWENTLITKEDYIIRRNLSTILFISRNEENEENGENDDNINYDNLL